MRIRNTGIGMAAYLAGVATVVEATVTTNTKIVFQMGRLVTSAIFSATQMIPWQQKSGNLTITKASLLRKTLTEGSSDTEIAEATSAPEEKRELVDIGRDDAPQFTNRRQSVPVGRSSPLSLDDDGSVTLTYTSQSQAYNRYNDILVPLYIRLDWLDSTGAETTNGSSYSFLFAFTTDTAETPTNLTTYITDANGETWNPVYGECSTGYGCGTSGTASSTSESPTATATSSPGSTSTASPSSSSSSTTTSASPGGLSTGATIGIAVACAVVGLALIAGALWFLCLRRRRRGNSRAALHKNNGYASDGVAAGIMADKELPHVTDSPHSAYAADRAQLHDPHEVSRGAVGAAGGIGAGVGAGTGLMEGAGHAAHSREDSYAPYSDHTPPPGVIGTEGGPASSQTSLPAGSTSSPTPISNRYAHLVEEGMTDDEIRRLDEEERALDEAIEDHDRSSRAQ